ncbi:SAM-dependent methyltransferase [Wenjunlia tyrosinilytica]|uniref:SAM-dependent methyltransferase n=1 Tax=Wenjunlia tyrosinilytica TaxID=1544741 RepID=A0A917ZJD5_9ACTN|nr:SAM-dependent methyltransferase [Wenjunlia tyrosinilytica]GGO83864.1 SAM-dependent methyltransferase [Wenjunlia tyrosinilytica]
MSDVGTRSLDEWSYISPTTPQPNIARIYDYLLGGKDNFGPDREVGDRIKKALPEVRIGVEQQRALLRRVVRHLVADVGLTRLVDIGSGLPTACNVHEVAQAINPKVRVAYVDIEPSVLAHARALLADNDETVVVEGDLRRPGTILDHPELTAHIDMGRPVGLLLCGILHHILDEEDPRGIMRQLCDRLAPGSHVFIHHLVTDGDPSVAQAQEAMRQGMGRGNFRSVEEVAELFCGLELVEPGLVHVPEWRPDPDTPSIADHAVLRLAVGGVARKP